MMLHIKYRVKSIGHDSDFAAHMFPIDDRENWKDTEYDLVVNEKDITYSEFGEYIKLLFKNTVVVICESITVEPCELSAITGYHSHPEDDYYEDDDWKEVWREENEFWDKYGRDYTATWD